MEFDLSSIPAGSTITAASFAYTTSSYTSSSGSGGLAYPQIEFHAYPGDGVLNANDTTHSPTNPVGTSPVITDTLTPIVTPFDAAALNSIFTSAPAPTWLGVWSYQAVQGLQASFYSTEGTSRPPSERPLLTLTYAPPPASNIYVTGHDLNVREFTPAGTLVRTLPVPYPGTRGIADDELRGTAVDHTGRLHLFNGTFKPHISTYDPATAAWTHRTEPGLSVTTPVTVGSVTTFGSLTYASDHRTFTNAATTANGIVRFNTAAPPDTQRFANSDSPKDNVIDLARGHDGLLYALTDNSDESGHVRVYNPYTMALLRTVTLPEHVRNIAVNADGDIFATTWGTTAEQGSLHRFNGTTGALLNSRPIADTAATLDLGPNGSIVVGTWTNGVYLTTQSLTPATQVVTGDLDTTFVSFARPVPDRGWKPAAPSSAWTNPANWNGPVPNSPLGDADSIAVFGPGNPSTRTVSLDADRTVGTLVFDSPMTYTVTGPSTLTLDTPAGQRPTIYVAQGGHVLAANVTLADDASVITAPGAFLDLRTSPGGAHARLDIADHTLVWDYAPSAATGSAASVLNTLRSYLQAAQNGTSPWAGPGITSSLAVNDPTGNTAIAYAQFPDDSAVTLFTTPYGDANLNGTIDPDDYALLDRSYALAKTGAHWTDGDFNYDGTITTADYLLIDRTLHTQARGFSPGFLSQRQSQFGPDYVTALLVAVPEPSNFAYLLASLPALLRRQKSAS
jgi:hypothetical protein